MKIRKIEVILDKNKAMEKLLIKVGDEEIECTPADPDKLISSNIDKEDVSFEILVSGKPLLNPDGTVFITTHNEMKKFYQTGKRLIVGVVADDQ